MKLILSILLFSLTAMGQIIAPSNIRTYKQFRNYILNPDAEYNVTTGVTDASGIVTRNTTAPINGVAQFAIDSTASGQTVKFKLNTLPEKFAANSGEATFRYFNNPGTSTGDYKWYVENASGVKVSPQTNILTSGTYPIESAKIIFNPGTTLNQPYYLVFESIVANATAMFVDDIYAGDVTSIGQFASISEWQTVPSTAVGTWLIGTTSNPTYGTIADNSARWRKVGSNMEIEWTLRQTAAGSSGSGQYEVDLSSLGVQIDTTKVVVSSVVKTTDWNTVTSYDWFGTLVGQVGIACSPGLAAVGTGGGAYVKSSTRLKFAPMFQFTDNTNRSFVWNSNNAGCGLGNTNVNFQMKVSVPIAGWSASQSAAAANQTDYGWTAYVPTVSAGFGTATNISAFYRIIGGEEIEVRGSHTNGTVAASLASISLPSICTLDSTKLSINNTTANPGSMIGQWSGATSGGQFGTMISAPSTSTSLVYFGANTGVTTKLTPQNGSSMVDSSSVFAYQFKVPCSGRFVNQRAPTLIGSVTSNSVSALRIESVRVAADGTVSNELNGDLVSGNCTNANPRVCTFGVAFSSVPNCFTNMDVPGGGGSKVFEITASSTTSVSVVERQSTTGASSQTAPFNMLCIGPR